MAIGPKTHKRRRIHLVRVVFWALNVPLVVALLYFRPQWTIPYLAVISVTANVEGAWSSFAADSPTEE